VLLSEAMNEAVRRRRPEVTEQMLVLACSQCGRSFEAHQLPVMRTTRKLVYRCPEDGAGAGRSAVARGAVQ
jgi:hypothetical protein